MNKFMLFFFQICREIQNYSFWGTFAIFDIKLKYARSKLGFFWSFVNTFIWILALFIVFKNVFQQNDISFLLYMSIGIIIFNFMESTISESSLLLSTNRNLLLNVNVSIFFFFIRNYYKNFIILLLSSIIYILQVFFVEFNYTAQIYIFPFLLIIFSITIFSMSIVIGIICTRFRDLIHLTHIGLRIMFIITPVFWIKSILKDNKFILDYNPFYYLLEMIRNPLMGKELEIHYIYINMVLCIFITFLALITLYFTRYKIKHWL